jgi:hypothetical protein
MAIDAGGIRQRLNPGPATMLFLEKKVDIRERESRSGIANPGRRW